MSEPSRQKRRKNLTDKMVAALPREPKRYILADPEQRGHYVRVPPKGPCVFAAVARSPHGKQVWATLGSTAELKTIEEARDKARDAIRRIKQGLAPIEPAPVQPDSFAAVAENWLKRHVMKDKLRTADQIKRVLEKYVLPVWRDRVFVEIKRSDIALLLDAIEDENGTWMADSVLSVLRAMAGWYAARDDSYLPPFVKKMRRTPPQDRKRERILSDDELRKVWKTAQSNGDVYGAFVRVSLLTAQRCAKTVAMRWTDIAPDGTWTIPTEKREKGNPGRLRLPALACKIITQQPHLVGNPFVFAGQTAGPISGFSARHEAFKASSGTQGWRVHDLRRTARSLMSKAGVRRDVAERVLGHAVGSSVEAVYDQHDYHDEKADALARLAALIKTIVYGGPPNHVAPLRAPGQP
jgi:integrase